MLSTAQMTVGHAQKISIYFDNALTSTPSVSKAPLRYNKDFAYSLTLDDATVDALTHALPLLQGGIIPDIESTFSPLYYTDGCGNNITFKAGVAWNSVNIFGADLHDGTVKGYLTWDELDKLYNLGWDVYNHSFSHKSQWTNPMSQSEYLDEIVKNRLMVKEKTEDKVKMQLFVVPSGDPQYQNLALQSGYKAVFDQSGELIGRGGLQITDNMNLSNLKIHRQSMWESMSWMNQLENVAEKSRNGGFFWYNEFVHRVDSYNFGGFNFFSFKNQMTKLANNWGKNGSDRVWMAPLQEVFEYLVLRQNIKYQTQLSGKKLDITFNFSQVPAWLRRKTLTLTIKAPSRFSRVETSSGIKSTFNNNSTIPIINLDFTDYYRLTNTIETDRSVECSVFPNPVVDFVEFALPENTRYQYTLTDVSGRIHLSSTFLGSKHRINVQNLSAGLYIVHFTGEKIKATTKFVKK